MQTVLYILLAILILLVMVTIHELGHYIAAKLCKFKVTEFSIGFGPKIFQITKKSGEKFSLRAIPLGGYCAFEDTDENGVETEKSFFKEKPYKRMIVLASGAALNFISAILFSFIYLVSVGYAAPVVANVAANPFEPEEYYSELEKGDEILAVGDYEISPTVAFADAVKKAKKDSTDGQPVVFTVLHDGAVRKIDMFSQQITPSYAGFGIEYSAPDFDKKGNIKTHPTVQSVTNDPDGAPYNDVFNPGDQITAVYIDGKPETITSPQALYELTKDIPIGEKVQFTVIRDGAGTTVSAEKKLIILEPYDGYGFTPVGEVRKLGFGKSLLYSVPFTGKMAGAILGSLGGLFTGDVAVTDMAGPIGTISQMAEYSQADWRNILVLLPLLAANLAIFNLLPLPVLDGSKILFTTIEWIRRKPINRKIENTIHFVGLIVLMVFVITIDIVGFILRGGAGTGWLRL